MKHLISIRDLSIDEIQFLFDLTGKVRREPAFYAERLKGKNLGLIFEKASTRTWASFHAGMSELGGNTLYFGPQDIAMGKREEIRDIARVLSSYLAGIVMRTYSHQTITEFAKYSSKPVINGLSDHSHPCQALTDFYTIIDKFGAENLKKLKIVYVGDGNNVLNSLLFLSAKLGASLYYATPKNYAPKANILTLAKKEAKKTSGKIVGTVNPKEAVRGAHVIYTDVWISMGEEDQAEEKKKHFAPYQVNRKLLSYASKDVQVMHCLPAHRGEEITNDVIEGKHSLVFEQAANRLRVQKAILLYLLTSIGRI